MLAATRDWFRTGQAWGELATTLAAAGANTGQVREAWEQTAQAYTQAGAHEEANAFPEHGSSPEFGEAQPPADRDQPEIVVSSESG